jgi:hypothetical protein
MSPFTSLLAKIARIFLSLLPWALALYLLYWLEHGDVWAVDMPFRGLVSVIILAVGMGLSFALHSFLGARSQTPLRR